MTANPLPVQPAKIHRPLLRDDTLSRERLNGWLETACRGRIALIVGDAGFGKTTLLADWSRHTARQTAWYRLEPDDRDWLTFIRHLVAGGREVDPGFAPETYRLLVALGPGGPTQAEIVASLAGEMAAFGAASADGFSVILDDFQAIDASDETDPIVRALIEHTGLGFSLVIASRTAPKLPAGRLRARGAIMRIEGEHLGFDVPETDRLFREAYNLPLDPDVVTDLVARTEGWAALLSLVRTNLEERVDPDPRALVAQLSASRGDLYDFLAEEVMADLPTDLQSFLTRVSVLSLVDVSTAALVDDRSAALIATSIAQSETLGLLLRQDRDQPHRFHPLVRDFLVARLQEEVGEEAVRQLHGRIARALQATNWREAAWHYQAAGDPEKAARVVDDAIPSILAAGSFDQALPFLDGSAPQRVGALVLRSRIEFVRGNLARAVVLAEAAAAFEGDRLRGTALLNLSSIQGVAGFEDKSIEATEVALQGNLAESERHVAEASVLLHRAHRDGNLEDFADVLRSMASQQAAAHHFRYSAISRLNLAIVLLWLGDPRSAVDEATRAEAVLERAPGSVERVAAMIARAEGLTQLGRLDEAGRAMLAAESSPSILGREEAALEIARIHGDYGSIDRATSAIERLDGGALSYGYRGLWIAVSAAHALRRWDLQAARNLRDLCLQEELPDVAGELRRHLVCARVGLALGDGTAAGEIAELKRLASTQRSRPGLLLAGLLAALSRRAPISTDVTGLGPDEAHLLSMIAEEVSRSLHQLTSDGRESVFREAAKRPERWRGALRLAISSSPASRLVAARLLAEIGSVADAAFLRDLSSTHRDLKPAAAEIARRIAPRVLIHDLGVVRLEIGSCAPHRSMRRKVLALLCFLASRPGLAATKDEALEAMWPDLGPDAATNSLHQAIYYLRRLIDPSYREGISAGYLEFDGDVITLSDTLVDTTSQRCWRLLAGHDVSDLEAVEHLVDCYVGRYALDFAYENWTSAYRETLHAAVLGRIEAAVDLALRNGETERAIRIGQKALAIDSSADAIELNLLRAYKASGRLSAAAEQYAHYAASMRDDLGLEPPPFEAL